MLDQLTILAPGLLGGSIARGARARNLAGRIVIWARRAETRQALAAQPWCNDAVDTLAEAGRGASLVVIAAPVEAIVSLAVQILPHLAPGTAVTDVGSVKGRIAREGTAALAPRAHFVGAHPMAGSEKTGWENGTANLFERRTCFVTPLTGSDAAAVSRVNEFWRDLGAEVVVVDPDRHDEIVAHISHLPQAVASSLCSFLAGKDPAWRNYAGGGLRDTTRIAASDPQLWRGILEENRDQVRKALREFQAELQAFERALDQGDWADLTARLARGKAYREQWRI